MTKQELNNLVVWQQAGTGYEQSGQKDLNMKYAIRLLNYNKIEVVEVAVALNIYRNGKFIYRSAPQYLSRLYNESLPHMGSILPGVKTLRTDLSFIISSNYWTTQDALVVEVMSGLAWDGKTDLNNAGHLYTKTFSTKSADMIRLYDQNPSLLKVKGQQGLTPIFMALSASDLPLVKYLESKGAKLTGRTPDQFNALFAACMGGSDANRDYVFQKTHISVNSRLTRSSSPLLQEAIMAGWVDATKWLLKNGADPNAKELYQMDCANAAVREGQEWAPALLAKYKANLKAKDQNGYGLMHTAVQRPNMFPILVKLGLSVNDAAPPSRITPLMMAAWLGRRDSVKWLVANGANLKAKDSRGRTAQDFSRFSNTLKTDRFFLEAVAQAQKKKK